MYSSPVYLLFYIIKAYPCRSTHKTNSNYHDNLFQSKHCTFVGLVIILFNHAGLLLLTYGRFISHQHIGSLFWLRDRWTSASFEVIYTPSNATQILDLHPSLELASITH